jgi:hypothetical protein
MNDNNLNENENNFFPNEILKEIRAVEYTYFAIKKKNEKLKEYKRQINRTKNFSVQLVSKLDYYRDEEKDNNNKNNNNSNDENKYKKRKTGSENREVMNEMNDLIKNLNLMNPNMNNNININNINNNININEMGDINELFKDNNININPFQEAYDLLNAKQNIFNFEDNNLMLESLDSLHSTITQFNSILNKTIGMDNNSNSNDADKNGIKEKENKILEEILDFLLQSCMLKNTIINMKQSIENSFQKNKNNLSKDENEKYKEALLNADNILNETNKVHPDKDKIMDSLQKLHQISNDI